MRRSTLIKIAHGVFGALGAFHLFFGMMLSTVVEETAPRAPNPVTGHVVRWEFRDDDTYRVVYVTAADQEKWEAFNVVGAVFLAICGALFLYLWWDARREGRTSIY